MKIERLRRKKLIFRDPFSLFPAQAGVILFQIFSVFRRSSFPRASGGDPSEKGHEKQYGFFSPRKRGGSFAQILFTTLTCLFPAQAGVILCAVWARQVTNAFPRASGGDPIR